MTEEIAVHTNHDYDENSSVSSSSLIFITKMSFADSVSLPTAVAYSHEMYPDKDDECLTAPAAHAPIAISNSLIESDESSRKSKANMATPLVDIDRNQLSSGNSIQIDQIRNNFRSLAAQYYGVSSARLLTSCNLRDRDSDNSSDVLLSLPSSEIRNERNVVCHCKGKMIRDIYDTKATVSLFNLSFHSIVESSFAESVSLPSVAYSQKLPFNSHLLQLSTKKMTQGIVVHTNHDYDKNSSVSSFNLSFVTESSFADSVSLPSVVGYSHEMYPDKDDEWWTSSISKKSPLGMSYSEPSQYSAAHESIATSDSPIASDESSRMLKTNSDKEFRNNYCTCNSCPMLPPFPWSKIGKETSFTESSFSESVSPPSAIAYYPEKRDEWWESSQSSFSSLGTPYSETSQSTVAHESITTSQSSIASDKSSRMLKTDMSKLQLMPSSAIACYPENDEWWTSSLSNFSSLSMSYSKALQSTTAYKPITTSDPSTVPDESSRMLKTDMATLPLMNADRNQSSYGNSIQLDQMQKKFRLLETQHQSSCRNSIQLDQMQKKFRSLVAQYYNQTPRVPLERCNE